MRRATGIAKSFVTARNCLNSTTLIHPTMNAVSLRNNHQSYSIVVENVNGAPRFKPGKSDFQTIRNEKLFFVDNTRFIAELQKFYIKKAIMHRPSRFGKSLFLSTLSTYYDKAIREEECERLFEDLYVSKNPVPGAGKYFVLHLDLSVSVDGDKNALIANLHKKINESVMAFAAKYKIPISDKYQMKSVHFNSKNSFFSLSSLCGYLALKYQPIFVLIDEYDHFANKLLFENPQIDKTEDVASGWSFIHSLFETLKSANNQFTSGTNKYSAFRVFAVGVCPLTLSYDGSAYCFEDITHNPIYADMFGFKQDDLKMSLESLVPSGKVKSEQVPILLELMKSYYNGFQFCEGQQERLYNPTLILNFLSLCYEGFVDKLLKLPLPIEIDIMHFVQGEIGNNESESSNLRNIFDKLKSNEIINVDMNLLNDCNVEINENVFTVLDKSPLTSTIFTELMQGSVNLGITNLGYFTNFIICKLNMKELFGTFHQSDIPLLSHKLPILSVMFYLGVVTIRDSKVPAHLQIPNYLVRVQIVNRIIAKVKDQLRRFVETCDTKDLMEALKMASAMLDPMKDTYNESSLKMLTIEFFRSIEHLGLQVYTDYRNNPSGKSIDLHIITQDNRSIFIDFKILMPHNLVLDHLDLQSDGTNMTIHLWTVDDKIQVYRYLKNIFFLDLPDLKLKENSIETYRNISECLREGRKQITDFGKVYMKMKSENSDEQPPVMFLVSAVWNLQVNVAKLKLIEE